MFNFPSFRLILAEVRPDKLGTESAQMTSIVKRRGDRFCGFVKTVSWRQSPVELCVRFGDVVECIGGRDLGCW